MHDNAFTRAIPCPSRRKGDIAGRQSSSACDWPVAEIHNSVWSKTNEDDSKWYEVRACKLANSFATRAHKKQSDSATSQELRSCDRKSNKNTHNQTCHTRPTSMRYSVVVRYSDCFSWAHTCSACSGIRRGGVVHQYVNRRLL